MPVTLVSPDAISSREDGTPHVGLSTLGALAHFVPQAQRKHPQHGGAPSELIAVLAVEGRGVPARCRRRVVGLTSTGVAVTRAFPAHDCAFCPESVTVAEYPTTQHQMSIGCDRGPGGAAGAETVLGSMDGVVHGSGEVAS